MPTAKTLNEEDDKAPDVNVTFEAVGEDEQHVVDLSDQELVADQAYLNSSRMTRFARGVLLQMIMFGALSFVGPAMSDAISNLGGGGLSTPYLANLASSLNYAASCAMTLFGGPLINKIGIKWSCVIAAIAFPLSGSGYYVSARYGVDWYLLFAKIVSGITSGFLYVAETTAMLSYPHLHERGKYLGIWSAMRNSGSVIGGAINFSTNYSTDSAGGIAWSTYLIFVGFECSGVIWALMLSQTRNVRRYDGTRIPYSKDITWKGEFQALYRHACHKRTWLVFMPAFYSFFYGGVYGTYLSLHFSVRARALSSLIVPTCTILMVTVYGILLDNKRWTQRQKAACATILWVVPQAAGLIWTGCIYGKYGQTKIALDYGIAGREWAAAYLPYFIVFTTGYWTQLSLYWILGTFSSDTKSSSRTGGLFRAFETAGQAVSYAINSHASDARVPLYIQCALLALSVPCMVALIRLVPEKPASLDDVADAAPVIEAVAKSEMQES
ncbi:membrane protein [Kwoniella heveanensis BCC8398]|uniref:Membrane protein n=1 Tax=Kwoniella heveanensis BCC8398 TaxID=1296120 RepID=A0A1B9GMQ3_9TREE|nr:membrane protein [Kwoniella heveanensis BCC8398]